MTDWTPTQTRILAMLSDGQYHRKKELWKCLNDELGHPNNLAVYIFKINEKLKDSGEAILCSRENNDTSYRHVRIMSIAE